MRSLALSWLALLLAAPTLIAPVELWHHHHDHGGDCVACVTAKTNVAGPVATVESCTPEIVWRGAAADQTPFENRGPAVERVRGPPIL